MSVETKAAGGGYQPVLRTEQYEGLARVYGPIIVIDNVEDVTYDESVEITLPSGEVRRGRVLEVGNGRAVVEVWGGTTGVGRRAHPGPLLRPVDAAAGGLGHARAGFQRPGRGDRRHRAADRRESTGHQRRADQILRAGRIRET